MKKNSIAKTMLSVVCMLVVLFGATSFSACSLFNRDAVTGTELELSEYAIGKVVDRIEKILNDYQKSSVGTLSIDSTLMEGAPEITDIDDSSSRYEELSTYFDQLSGALMLPAMCENVMNNTTGFKLGTLYYDTEGSDQRFHLSVNFDNWTLDGAGSDYITCMYTTLTLDENDNMEFEYTITTEIEYDFHDDKLISVKYVTVDENDNDIVTYINFVKNEIKYAKFSTDRLSSVIDGSVPFSWLNEIEEGNYGYIYSANIASNIDLITVDVAALEGENRVDLFNDFSLKSNYCSAKTIILPSAQISSNDVYCDALLDSLYVTTKTEGQVRKNPESEIKYQYIRTGIDYSEACYVLNEVETLLSGASRDLVLLYRDYLQENGETEYNGYCTYQNGDNYLTIIKEVGANKIVYIIEIDMAEGNDYSYYCYAN